MYGLELGSDNRNNNNNNSRTGKSCFLLTVNTNETISKLKEKYVAYYGKANVREFCREYAATIGGIMKSRKGYIHSTGDESMGKYVISGGIKHATWEVGKVQKRAHFHSIVTVYYSKSIAGYFKINLKWVREQLKLAYPTLGSYLNVRYLKYVHSGPRDYIKKWKQKNKNWSLIERNSELRASSKSRRGVR